MSSPPRATWTGRVREFGLRTLPPQKLLPDEQPVYVSSWIYVFGVLSLASFVVVLFSGLVIALFGPTWWHVSGTGHFFNSMHLWSVEFFFFFLAIHLWAKFFMAAWRGRRGLTWLTGVIAFAVSIGTAFTGYLSQQNFDSQWIGGQAKDGLNSVGVGAFFNVLDFGQMLLFHVLVLPLLLGVVIVVHILLVRHRGVVPPFPARRRPNGNDASVEPGSWPGEKARS